jgi:hypothetical protein
MVECMCVYVCVSMFYYSDVVFLKKGIFMHLHRSVFDMIYLTAVGLAPGGSRIHLHTIRKTTQSTKQYIHISLIRKSAGRAQSL